MGALKRDKWRLRRPVGGMQRHESSGGQSGEISAHARQAGSARWASKPPCSSIGLSAAKLSAISKCAAETLNEGARPASASSMRITRASRRNRRRSRRSLASARRQSSATSRNHAEEPSAKRRCGAARPCCARIATAREMLERGAERSSGRACGMIIGKFDHFSGGGERNVNLCRSKY